MSVRRLSPNQPASFEFSKATLKAAQAWMANFPAGKQQSAVVPHTCTSACVPTGSSMNMV